MNLDIEVVEQSFTYLGICPTDFDEALKRIEWIGRMCYQSYDKITDISYRRFTSGLSTSGHWAMIEHSYFILYGPYPEHIEHGKLKYHTIIEDQFNNGWYYIGGNFRAWMNITDCLDVNHLPYKIKEKFNATLYTQVDNDDPRLPSELIHVSVILRTDRAVTHELVRHRPCSYGQLSQRYVNHLKKLLLIKPVHIAEGTIAYSWWEESCKTSLEYYAKLRDLNCTPQQARTVLPNSMYTEIGVTASLTEWAWIFHLRCATDAYPQIRELMNAVRLKFQEEFIGFTEEEINMMQVQ